MQNKMQTAFHLYISRCGFTLFLKRILRLGPPLTSWRSQKRFGGWNINPLIPVLAPNLMLLSLCFETFF
ncbi:hypothetical protein MKW92_044321 [Papaver armeniacum]|nr:hypothetical protein MKW92_044321 [Papaver armeniacum]